jgi:hypothetical protein
MKSNVMIMNKGEAKSVVQHWVSRIVNEAELEWSIPEVCNSSSSNKVWFQGCNRIKSIIDAELITKDEVDEMFDKEREKIEI